jgi:phage baseplate assembly protein W
MSLVGKQSRKTYSFKSAGLSDRSSTEVDISVAQSPPIGIKTPMRLSNEDGLFDMHRDIAKQVSDNLRNLILTNHGERLGRYKFGANIMPLVFSLGSEDADKKAIQRIKSAVGKSMPYVSLSDFQVFIEHNDTEVLAQVGIKITYMIPRVDNKMRSLEVILYAGG